MKIAKETWVILAIGIADLITTIIFIKHHGAEEANPLFRRYWEMGVMTFVVAKIALLVGPLCVLEWARKRNPSFVSWALRTGIAGYLVMYGIGFVRLNSPARADAMVNIAQAEANQPATIDTRLERYIHLHETHRRLFQTRMYGVRSHTPFVMPKRDLSNLTDGKGNMYPRITSKNSVPDPKVGNDTAYSPTY